MTAVAPRRGRGGAVASPRLFPCEDWATPREVGRLLAHARARRTGRGTPHIAVREMAVQAAPEARDVAVQVSAPSDDVRDALLAVGRRAMLEAWVAARRTFKRRCMMLILRMHCYTFGVVDALFPGVFRAAGPRGGKPPALQVQELPRREDLEQFRAVLGPTFDVAPSDGFNIHHYELDVDAERPIRVLFRPRRMTLRVEFIKAELVPYQGDVLRYSKTLEQVRREVAYRATLRRRRVLQLL